MIAKKGCLLTAAVFASLFGAGSGGGSIGQLASHAAKTRSHRTPDDQHPPTSLGCGLKMNKSGATNDARVLPIEFARPLLGFELQSGNALAAQLRLLFRPLGVMRLANKHNILD